MHTDHDSQILYIMAWKAKEYIENLIYGEPVHSFQQLSLYLYKLEQKNPWTMTKLNTDAEN